MDSRLAIQGGTPARRTGAGWPAWPEHGEAEQARVSAVLASGQWGDVNGAQVKALCDRFAALHQSRYGLAVSSGTAALWIALKAFAVGPGDEVIIPAYTFVATVSVVLELGATPVFVDIAPGTLHLDPQELAEAVSEKTRAIIPVHMAGIPANMPDIVQIAHSHGIPVIEDAAQAHGARWNDTPVGAWGEVGCFSFQASKNLSAGEGGMLVVNDADRYATLWSLHNCGRKMGQPWYLHFTLGENWRMTELQAALLLAQLERWPDQHARRQRNAAYLRHCLGQLEEVALPTIFDSVTPAWHLFPFWAVDAHSAAHVARIAEALQAEGLPISAGYPMPLYQQPLFAKYPAVIRSTQNPGRLINTERACQKVLWIPQSALLGTYQDMDDLVLGIQKVLSQVRQGRFPMPGSA